MNSLLLLLLSHKMILLSKITNMILILIFSTYIHCNIAIFTIDLYLIKLNHNMKTSFSMGITHIPHPYALLYCTLFDELRIRLIRFNGPTV